MIIRFFRFVSKQIVRSSDGSSTRVYCISTWSIFEYDNHRTSGLKVGSQVAEYLSTRFIFLFSLILSSQGHLDRFKQSRYELALQRQKGSTVNVMRIL